MRTSLLSAGLALSAVLMPFGASANSLFDDHPHLIKGLAAVETKAEVKFKPLNQAIVDAVKDKRLASPEAKKQITLNGTVSSLNGTDIVLKVGESLFTVHTNADTKFTPHSGAGMTLANVQLNDRLAVQGLVQADKEITAIRIQDLSLQVRRATFSGTVSSIATDEKSFVLKTNKQGVQTISLDQNTKIQKNGEPTALSSLTIGSQVTVNGIWNRTNETATAEKVNIKVPLVRVRVEGSITAKEGNVIRVLTADQKTYVVDIKPASIVFSQYLRMNAKFLNVGDTVDVWARGEAGSLNVKAYFVRDLSQINATTHLIQLRDQGTTVQAEVGDRLVLKLGNGYVWSAVASDNTTVVAPVSGQSLTLKAATAGKAELTLTGEPRCRAATPACATPALSFRVYVNVVAQAS